MVFTKDLKIVDCKGFEGLYMHIYIYDFKGLRISKKSFSNNHVKKLVVLVFSSCQKFNYHFGNANYLFHLKLFFFPTLIIKSLLNPQASLSNNASRSESRWFSGEKSGRWKYRFCR